MRPSADRPRFTIVVPTLNGGGFLPRCVDSVLAQTDPSWEMAVLDAGSTDGSMAYLRGLSDPRVTIHPARRHLGIEDNWARALETPRGEFMTLLGDDDLLDPDYLQVMDGLIHGYPDATLYHARFRLIDRDGRVLKPCSPLPARETAAGFLAARLGQRRESFGTGYLMRSADYDAVGGIPPFEKLLFADDALWIALMRRGYKATAPQACFSYRVHTASTSARAEWRSHIKAMTQYVAFLRSEASGDADIAEVFRAKGPAFFLDFCRHMYLLALVEATQHHRRVSPEALSEISAALTQVDASLCPGLPVRRDLRVRGFVNRNPAARLLYNLYVLGRHGEWNGAKVRPGT